MKAPKEEELAFFGKITAGMTHEMKNILAIIRESSGLIEDLLSISKEAPIPYREKIQNALSTVRDQVRRGVDVTARLNRFAHSTDAPTAQINLHELTGQLIALSQRFARLKNVVLDIHPSEPPDPPITVVTYPVQFQMALFAGIECCLNQMPAGGRISLFPRANEGKTVVHMGCDGDIPDKTVFVQNLSLSEKWPELQRLAVFLGGTVELDESAPGILLSLTEETVSASAPKPARPVS